MADHNQQMRIHGAGGGSKGKAHTPVEAPNTLQSAVKGRILDLLAYGPIFGLVDGLKSVYLDSTPVQNPDGTNNFSGVVMETREGYPDQDMIPGFPTVENSIEVNTEVLFDTPPVRSVSNNDADAVLITVQLAALVRQETNGDSVGAAVTVYVDTRQGNGQWVTRIGDTINGKTTSPYPRTYRVNLERNGIGNYQVRVRRGNKESSSSTVRDQVNWTLLTEVIDRRMSYPNMAMVGISVDSKLFGSSLPSRSYDVKLSIVSVPSNYDPATRTYTGLWDGTFKQAWTDNPAWAYYDLATHPVIGAGISTVDKWSLYRIGQYADELVDDGFGGMEPRFTLNTVFSEQEDAIQALNTLASAFRGMSYWGTDTVVPVADMPTTPVKIVAPANVIDGELEYSGTSERERHSVCVVMWNDPNDEFKAVPEIYEDRDSIDKFGWRETRVTAVGCSSRGQALRLAKWILYSERAETQSLTYKATLDHADLRPGDIIEVADPDYQGARMAGRIMVPSQTAPVLDQVPTEAVQSTQAAWFLKVLMPDGSIHTSQVSSFQGNTAHLLTGLPDLSIDGAMWALFSLSLQLPQFRVVSVTEEDGGIYSILATEYDPRKYDIVEKDLILPDRPTSMLPTGPVAPPLDLSFEAYTYFAGGSEHQGLIISWTPPKDVRVSEYVLDVKSPADGGFRTVYNGPGMSFDLRDAMGGEWIIRVRAVASTGVPSQWVSRTVQIANLLLPVPPDSVIVVEKTFEITLSPVSAYRTQLWEFYRSNVPLSADQIETNATKLPTGTYLVDVGLRSNRTYYYYIRGINQYGVSTWFATQGTTQNNFDDIMEAVKKEIMEGDTYIWLQQQIETVATDAANAVVDEKVAELQEQIDNLVDALAYDPTKAYTKYQVVKGTNDGMLWQATGPVPADPSGANGPPNPMYWRNIGEATESVDAMAAQVEENRVGIEELDGKVTASAQRVSGLVAAVRRNEDEQAQGAAQSAIDAYKTKASFNQKIKVVADEVSATVEKIESLEVKVDNNTASIVTLDQVVTNGLASNATSIQTLRTEFEGNKASVQNQITVLTDAQSAQATALQTLNTDYQGNKATVQNQLTALSSAQSAQATQISTLQTSVGNNSAAIQVQADALTTLDGRMKASYGIKVQTNTAGTIYTAGMGIDVTTNNGITQTQIVFQADRFSLINVANGVTTLPFLIDSGVVYINSAMIKTGSIDFLKISDTIQSDNYVANSTGWKLWKNGTFELNGPVAGGGRMKITNQVILVYDANGVLRVRLGIW